MKMSVLPTLLCTISSVVNFSCCARHAGVSVQGFRVVVWGDGGMDVRRIDYDLFGCLWHVTRSSCFLGGDGCESSRADH
jgi:hypothetical protein